MATFGPSGASEIDSKATVTDALGFTPSVNSYKTLNVGGNADTFYPCIFSSTGPQSNRITIWKSVHDYATWDGIVELELEWSGRGWGSYVGSFDLIRHRFASKNFVANIVASWPVGNSLIIWLRGGGRNYHYVSQFDETFTAYTSSSGVQTGSPPSYSDTKMPTTTVESLYATNYDRLRTQYIQQNTNGEITTPNRTAFFAHKTGAHIYETQGSHAIGGGWSTDHNQGTGFNTSNGRFIAPTAGRYFFSWSVMHKGTVAYDYQPRILKNGASYANSNQTNDGSAWNQCTVTAVMSLSTSDYVEPGYYTSGTNTTQHAVYSGGRFSHFCGHMIG